MSRQSRESQSSETTWLDAVIVNTHHEGRGNSGLATLAALVLDSHRDTVV